MTVQQGTDLIALTQANADALAVIIGLLGVATVAIAIVAVVAFASLVTSIVK